MHEAGNLAHFTCCSFPGMRELYTHKITTLLCFKGEVRGRRDILSSSRQARYILSSRAITFFRQAEVGISLFARNICKRVAVKL